jgi:hypothetical protein
LGDGLAYREAFTTDAAQAVVDHLVNNRGLQLDLDAVSEAKPRPAPTTECRAEQRSASAERRSALPGAVPEPGKVVFVYRKSRDSGLGVRDSGLGAGEKVSGIRCQVSGAEQVAHQR